MKKHIAALIVAGIAGQAEAAFRLDNADQAHPITSDPRCSEVVDSGAGTVDGQRFDKGRCVPNGKPVPVYERACQEPNPPHRAGTEKYYLVTDGKTVTLVMVTPCQSADVGGR